MMAIHFFLCFPETAGKTLEEVEDMFLSDVKPWNTHVQYQKSRTLESDNVDTEKASATVHHREGSEATAVTEHLHDIEHNGEKGYATTATKV